jgi:hypothetical protein
MMRVVDIRPEKTEMEVDRNRDADRPIILESFERSEITGPPGIDGYTSRKSLFTLIVSRIEKWLIGRREIS